MIGTAGAIGKAAPNSYDAAIFDCLPSGNPMELPGSESSRPLRGGRGGLMLSCTTRSGYT
jgi:hypothetical protein